MSTSPESELDLDLQFLPAWAQSPSVNRYAKYEGVDQDSTRRRGNRPDRRERRRERRPGDKVPGSAPGGDDRPGRIEPREKQETTPLPEVQVSFVPEEKGVDSIARQIKLTGRAYPLFEIGTLILKKPDRYQICLKTVKKAEGQVAQGLWGCNLDNTVWLSEQEAVSHVIRNHFTIFYQSERIPTDPPKGTYTFVAQCGMSGTILGPPNYHDYQLKLRKLHAERFSRMPFEVFKARVRIVRDEAVVKKWLDEQSFKTEYICLNVPEAKRLTSMEEVENHFREIHLANIIRPVDAVSVSGAQLKSLPGPLQALVHRCLDEQKRFPLKVVHALSQQFAARGLQFFKVNKTITYVAVARPHYLEINTTPVSEGVKRIVQFIESTRHCTRRKLLEALAPLAAAPAARDGTAPSGEAAPTDPTPEQTAVITDLHWLIHQGHVIEFTNGLMEVAKKPAPKPPKPAAKPKTDAPAEAPVAEEQPMADAIPAGEESEGLVKTAVSDQSSGEQSEAASTPATATEFCSAGASEPPAADHSEGLPTPKEVAASSESEPSKEPAAI